MTDHARPQQTPPSSLVPAALEPYVDPSVVDGATSFDISAVDFHGDAAPATIGFTSPSGDSLKNPQWYRLAHGVGQLGYLVFLETCRRSI